MTIREARKEQWKSIKNRSAKEKFSFFWEYYGIKTIALTIAAALAIAFVVGMIIKKDNLINLLLNLNLKICRWSLNLYILIDYLHRYHEHQKQ